MSDLRKLSQLVSPVNRKIFPGKNDSRPYIGLENLGVNWSGLSGFENNFESVSVNSVFEDGDILFGKLRPNLRKCEQVNFEGRCSTDLLVLRAKPDVNRRFAGHFLKSDCIARVAVRSCEGTKMPRTSWRSLESVQVFCPGVAEQQEIVKILDAASEAVRFAERSVAKLNVLRGGMVSCLIESLRFSENLGDYIILGPQNGLYKHESAYKNSGVPILRIDSFGGGFIQDLQSLRRLSVTSSEMAVYGLRKNDLVINRVNSIDYIGKSAIASHLHEQAVFESNVMRVRVRAEELVPEFAALMLSGPKCLSYLRSQAKSAISQASINQRDVRSCPIAVPPLDEQRRIVSVIEAHDARIAAERAHLAKLRALKAGLMDDLLTGRVRVNQLDDLPV